jgi:predicted DNA-binding transcriptional regulator AlpA
MTDRLLTLPEIAEITRVPVDTLRWYRHVGARGPRTFRLGRRVVAYESEVLAWIEAQRTGTPAA